MAAIPHTQRKLRESRFFLQHLKDTSALEEPFLFYLSAFLAAASSVVSVLKTEGKIKDASFKRWRRTLSEDERRLLNSMTNRRNAEVHQIPPHPEIQLVAATPVLDRRRRLGRMEVFAPREFKAIGFLYLSGRPREIISACTDFTSLLEKLILEFSNKDPEDVP
jgi:hypothetical protein